MKPLSLSERLNQFATDQDDLSRRGEKNLAAEAAQTIDLLTAERDQLAAQAEELKAMHVDAIGDGWYDGYLACKKDVSNEHFDIDTVNDSDVLEWSEHYESEHRYSKSIADIRAKAIRKFVSDANQKKHLRLRDGEWLEYFGNEWLEEAAKGGE